MVIDTAEPLTLRNDSNWAATIHEAAHNKRATRRSRLALLFVSKTVNIEASWVIYDRVMLHLEINASLGRLGDVTTDKNIKAFWLSAAKFRVVHLVLPFTKHAEILSYRTALLYTTIHKLLSRWEQKAVRPNTLRRREVVVHLARLFDLKTPSSRASAALVELLANETERCKRNLEIIVALVGKKTEATMWTFAAMSDLSESERKKGGRKMLRKFRETLDHHGIGFVGLSREEVPVVDVETVAVESFGPFRGTHRRWVE